MIQVGVKTTALFHIVTMPTHMLAASAMQVHVVMLMVTNTWASSVMEAGMGGAGVGMPVVTSTKAAGSMTSSMAKECVNMQIETGKCPSVMWY